MRDFVPGFENQNMRTEHSFFKEIPKRKQGIVIMGCGIIMIRWKSYFVF